MRRPRTRIEASSDLPPQSSLMLVYSDLQGMSVYTGGDRNNSLAHGFVGPTTLIDHWGCCVHGSGAIRIGPTLGLSC
jgi:hypothetical protein